MSARRVIPLRRSPPPTTSPDLREVARVRDQAEALVVSGLLEAHGIPVFHRTRVAPSVHPFTVGDQAEVQILVPHTSLTMSRRLLRRASARPPTPPGRRRPAPGPGQAR
jgi:hypothetical protein